MGQEGRQRGLGSQSEGKTLLKVERKETGRYIVLLAHHVPSKAFLELHLPVCFASPVFQLWFRRRRVLGSTLPSAYPSSPSQRLSLFCPLLLMAQLSPHYSLLSFSYGAFPSFPEMGAWFILNFPWHWVGGTQHRILVPDPQFSFITLKIPQGRAPSFKRQNRLLRHLLPFASCSSGWIESEWAPR